MDLDIDQEIREAERQYMDFLDDGVSLYLLYFCIGLLKLYST